jgi:dUTP pyrophosphatase
LIYSSIPLNKSVEDAGYDLKATNEIVIWPGEREIVDTGLRLDIPNGQFGRIESRSGLAFRNGLVAFSGVIDSGYAGEVKVLLFNHSEAEYTVLPGDRIAQIVFYTHLEVEGTAEVGTMPSTERGLNGFGSTGK